MSNSPSFLEAAIVSSHLFCQSVAGTETGVLCGVAFFACGGAVTADDAVPGPKQTIVNISKEQIVVILDIGFISPPCVLKYNFLGCEYRKKSLVCQPS